MSLEHAILGFLNYRPFSGYDLKHILDDSIRHFWPADQSQIYKSLARLADRGQATVELITQIDRPNRKVYHITDEGREAFMQWVSRMPEPDEVREPFLIQVFFAGMLPDDKAIEILEAKAAEVRKVLEAYAAIDGAPSHKDEAEAPPRARFFWYLTLECGIWSLQAQLAWLESTIERIRNKEYEGGPRILWPPEFEHS